MPFNSPPASMAGSRFLLPPSEEFLLKQQQNQLTVQIPTPSGSSLSPTPSPNQLTIASLPPSSAYYATLGASSAYSVESAPITPTGLGPKPPQRPLGSVDPKEAEAWSQLGTFLVGQLRFGYEMERLLQAELRRLNDQAAWEEEMERIAQGDISLRPPGTPFLPPSPGGEMNGSESGESPTKPGPLLTPDGHTPTFDEFPRIYLASSSNILVTNSVSQEIISRKSSMVEVQP